MRSDPGEGFLPPPVSLEEANHVTPIIVWKLQTLAPLAPKTGPIVGSIVGERGPLLLSLSHLLVFFSIPPFFLLFHHFLVPDTRHKLEETRQDLTSDPDDQLLLYLRPGKSRIKLARSRREEAGETTPNGVLPTVIRKMMLRDASSFLHLEKGIL